MKSTIDHEIIKNWILKWGGTPAIGESTEDHSGKGVLRINFNDHGEGHPISWEEFFDIFEADRLRFRYSDDVVKGNEVLAFNFVDRQKTARARDDETSLPDDNKMAEENMFNNFDPNQSY